MVRGLPQDAKAGTTLEHGRRRFGGHKLRMEVLGPYGFRGYFSYFFRGLGLLERFGWSD